MQTIYTSNLTTILHIQLFCVTQQPIRVIHSDVHQPLDNTHPATRVTHPILPLRHNSLTTIQVYSLDQYQWTSPFSYIKVLFWTPRDRPFIK